MAIDQKLLWLVSFGGLLLLILKQPNLSTAALMGLTLWMVALAAGLRWRSLLGTAFAGGALGTASILINEYQRLRVVSFLDPWNDPMGDGYQLVQSLLAIGSGGVMGQGYGLSTQKLQYLPIQSTDFIYAGFCRRIRLRGIADVASFPHAGGLGGPAGGVALPQQSSQARGHRLLHDPGGAIDPQHRRRFWSDAHHGPTATDDQLWRELTDVQPCDHGAVNTLFPGINWINRTPFKRSTSNDFDQALGPNNCNSTIKLIATCQNWIGS
jgi:hypothetical protein